MFEDLDFGDRVFKEEEHLFYIPDIEDKDLSAKKAISVVNDEDTDKLLRYDINPALPLVDES